MKRIAVDLAKSVYQVAESIHVGRVDRRRRFDPEAFRRYVQEQPEPVEWVMEACGTAHYWGRVAQARGHRVVLLHPCGFHAIRPHSPRSSGRAFHAHLAICSTTIRTGSRSAATQGWHCYSEVPGVVNLFARLRIDSPLRLIR